MWLARRTGAAYYGQYQAFWVQWQVLHVVACLGLPTLVLTYPAARLATLRDAVGRGHLAAFGGWVLLVAGAFAAVQQRFGSPFGAGPVAVFLVLGVPVAVLEAYALVRRQFAPVAGLSGVYAVLFLAAHAGFIGGLLGSAGLLNALLLGNTLRLAVLAYLARPAAGAGAGAGAGVGAAVAAADTPNPTPAPWAAVRSLWGHTAFNEVVQVLFRWVDKLVLSFLLPAALFALYFNGTLDVPFLPLLLGAAGSSLLLHFGASHRTDADRVAALRAAGTLLGRLVGPLFFFLVFFRRELFGVVFAHRYDAAVPLFLVASLVVPLRAYNFTALLQHQGRGRTLSTGAVLDLALALALMYPLYRLLGLAGVALAFVLSTYGQAAFYLGHTARLLARPWPQLLPWRAWAAQFGGAALALGLLHLLLARFLPEAAVLAVGAGLLTLWLAGQLWAARRAGA